MKIKNLDYLSQKISLSFYGQQRHSSLYGAILTIIMVLVCGMYILYLMINVILKNSSDYISYKKYLQNAGNFPFSNDINGIYHYFQFLNTKNNQYVEFDPKYIRVFMTHIYNGYKTNFKTLNKSEHWVYDLCREGIDDKKIPKKIFNGQNNIKNSACLRYYYNNVNKKYYSVDDEENFKFPYLNKGTGTNEFLYLNTVVEKCHNDSLFNSLLGECGNIKDLNIYIKNLGGIYLDLLEQQVETENHSNQIFHYLNSIPSSMNDSDIPINHINLSPFEIEIKKGIVYPKTKKTLTYIFDYNRSNVWSNHDNKYILTVFNYWLLNTVYVFKGGFNTLYDVLPSVGGICQLCYYIFFALNFLINQFTIIQDSKLLFFQMKNVNAEINEKEKKNFAFLFEGIRSKYQNVEDGKEKNNIISDQKNHIGSTLSKKKQKEIKGKFPPVFRFSQYKKDNVILLNNNSLIENSKKDNNSKKELNVNNISFSPLTLFNNNSNNDIKNESKDILLSKVKNYYTDIKRNSMKNKSDEIFEDMSPELISQKKNDNYEYFSRNLSKFISEKKQNIKLESISTNVLEKYISPCYFIGSLFNKKSKSGKIFYIINKFRKKLLSEEHIFRTHIFLYYFKKFFDNIESENIDITELYNYL